LPPSANLSPRGSRRGSRLSSSLTVSPVKRLRKDGTYALPPLLIQQGAKLVQSVEDIVEELSPIYRGAVQQPASAESAAPEQLSGLLPDEETVLGLLDTVEPRQLDDLAQRAPFSFARLQTALFALEVRGAIDSHPGCYYQRKSTRSLSS
jgi:predicted Rossmann fold nucleotide-binding protein DprA/Smf involved in DNA uptake